MEWASLEWWASRMPPCLASCLLRGSVPCLLPLACRHRLSPYSCTCSSSRAAGGGGRRREEAPRKRSLGSSPSPSSPPLHLSLGLLSSRLSSPYLSATHHLLTSSTHVFNKKKIYKTLGMLKCLARTMGYMFLARVDGIICLLCSWSYVAAPILHVAAPILPAPLYCAPIYHLPRMYLLLSTYHLTCSYPSTICFICTCYHICSIGQALGLSGLTCRESSSRSSSRS
jgi:hypothetical protein